MSQFHLQVVCIIGCILSLVVIAIAVLPIIIEDIRESNKKMLESGKFTVLSSNI